jgi:UDP-N-acetylglucosamine 2-epimerase (non-hydrolysing)
VITDSGGVQEEAEVLGKPLFIVRDESDRPESLVRASTRLVGTAPSDLILHLNEFFEYRKTSAVSQSGTDSVWSNIFGDGQAAQRIVNIIKHKYVNEVAGNNIIELDSEPVVSH